jgi:uncharacterized integral membrane protein
MVRTVIWVVVAVLLTAFAAMNFQDVNIHIWPGADGGWVVTWPLALVFFVSFMLGFLPPYIIALLGRWRLTRQIKQQEATINLLRTPAPAVPSAPALSVAEPTLPASGA